MLVLRGGVAALAGPELDGRGPTSGSDWVLVEAALAGPELDRPPARRADRPGCWSGRARRPGTRWPPSDSGSDWVLVRPRSPARNSMAAASDERIGLGAGQAALAGPELDGRRSDERIGLGRRADVATGLGDQCGREDRREGDDGQDARHELRSAGMGRASSSISIALLLLCARSITILPFRPADGSVRESDLAAGASAPQA